jgi:shikimate kinase
MMLAYVPGMALPDNVFLIGPMGAGKSTIGRHLAELLGRDFVDSDQELEKRTGASIPLIFEIEGEGGFRNRESSMLDELSARHGVVLATGGGAVLDPANRERLRDRGIVVYLQADIDTLVQRTRRDRNRPLLQNGDRRHTLTEMMKVRDPIYRETAHIIIHTNQRPPKAVARDILNALQRESDSGNEDPAS